MIRQFIDCDACGTVRLQDRYGTPDQWGRAAYLGSFTPKGERVRYYFDEIRDGRRTGERFTICPDCRSGWWPTLSKLPHGAIPPIAARLRVITITRSTAERPDDRCLPRCYNGRSDCNCRRCGGACHGRGYCGCSPSDGAGLLFGAGVGSGGRVDG